MRSGSWMSRNEILDAICQVKCIEAGRAKPYEETQTAKLYEKGINGNRVGFLGRMPQLSYMEFRLTNLTHTVSH
jgi:hypothetical protein